MTGAKALSDLQTFEYKEGGADQGKAIREKAYLVMDLMHNRHKLEIERDQAQEYRKKFYSSMSGGFSGAGGGSYSNADAGHGYSVPSSYQPSSYTAPSGGSSSMAGGGGGGGGGDGVSKVYSPYNASDDPVLKVPTSGALKWGAAGSTSNVMSSTGAGGSTYNITNNNISVSY